MYLIIRDSKVVWRVVDLQDGRHVNRPQEQAIALAARALGLPPDELEAWPVPQGQEEAYAREHLESLSVQRDQQGAISAVQAPSPLYLHIAFSGGDGGDPPGIRNDGSDALAITATLRASADPASPVIEIDGDWRITIRDDTGAVYDVIRISMSAGVASLSYTTSARPAICELRQSDFDTLSLGGNTYTVKLPAPATWKVYRNL